MPGRHRKPRNNALALRLAGGLVTGTALTAAVAAAYAGTASGQPSLGQGTAAAALMAPAQPMTMVAANTPAQVMAAGSLKAVPVRAAHARLVARQQAAAAPKQASRQAPQQEQKQAPRQAPAQAPKQASKQAPEQEVRKQDAAKQDAAKQPAGAKQAEKGAAAGASAQDVINLAKKQVGIEENANGVTKFQQWYMTTPAARQTVQRDGGSVSGYGNAAWCDMFVSWVGKQVGVRGMGQDAYTVEHAKWFQKAGRWGTTPKPGAVVFFAWNGGGTDGIEHVGLVVKDNGDGTIETVEGNTNDAVMVRERSTGSVVGYGYPQYAK